MSRTLGGLYFYGNDIQDAAMDRWLNWAVQYSGDTLNQLDIYENDLTLIPRQLSSLTNLKRLHFK